MVIAVVCVGILLLTTVGRLHQIPENDPENRYVSGTAN